MGLRLTWPHCLFASVIAAMLGAVWYANPDALPVTMIGFSIGIAGGCLLRGGL